MVSLDWLTTRPIAHRGFHNPDDGPVENTLSAVDAAIARDLAIEVDLQVSADGGAMVIHDGSLDRMTDETGSIIARSADELKQIEITGSGGDHIVELEQLLDHVDGRVPLVLEIKSTWSADMRIVDRINQLLANYTGAAAVMSFDPEIVARFARITPDLPRGIISDGAHDLNHWGRATTMERFGLRHLLHAPRTRPHFVAYDIRALPAVAPVLAKWLLGKPLLTWTVKTTEQIALGQRWADQLIFEGFDPAKL